MSRQNYYAVRVQRQRRAVDGDFAAELVRQERRIQPRIGGRKLYLVLQPALAEAGIKMGRDRLFAELRVRDLLVPRLPRLWPRTTHYNASLPVFRNEIRGLEVRRANEVWVVDITYVRTVEGFLYVSLITDKCSRKIVGYAAAETLETEGALQALRRALADLPAGCQPIHHSDRGCQYCSHEYVGVLQKWGLKISMTEEDHCAQNALAERVNGILKQEYGMGSEFPNKAQARKALKEGIHIYNTRRLHGAIHYQVPEVVHRRGTVALS
jgi:transposase InsO family protein